MSKVVRVAAGDTEDGHHRYEVRVNNKLQGVILAIMEPVEGNATRKAFKHYILERDLGKDQALSFDNEVDAIIECAKRNGRSITRDDIRSKK